jgi:hypothetical protein
VKKQAFSLGCILYVRAVAEIVEAIKATRPGHSSEKRIVCEEEGVGVDGVW